MDAQGPIDRQSALVDRAKNIILTPKQEWPVIDAEPSTIGDIYKSYVMILAAIPALAGLLGSLALGYSFLGITYRPSITSALGTAVTQYVMALISTFVLALIIEALAPSFGGVKNRVQAFKVAAYSSTAAWLAGVFALIPALGWLGIVGLYSLYLLYLGLPLLMKSPADKAMPYTVVTILAAIVLFVVIGAISGAVGGVFGSRMPIASGGEVSGTMNVPGVGSVDLGKLEAASKQMEATAKQMEAGATNAAAAGAVAPATLQAMLPASLGAYRRTEISSSSANAGGIGGVQAEARYENGANNIRLEVTDIAAAGAIAALGSAFNVQTNRQTETGYEKVETVDGRMVNEKWDNSSKNGSYGVLVANRFMINAEGTVSDIAELKQAVDSVGVGKLEALAHN